MKRQTLIWVSVTVLILSLSVAASLRRMVNHTSGQIDLKSSSANRREASSENGSGVTPLMDAARSGQTDRIRELLATGSDPNKRDTDGVTALIYAVANGHTDAAKLLIAAGADINVRSKWGQTAITSAGFIGRIDILELLLAKGGQTTSNDLGVPRIRPALEGRKDVVEYLLSKGANLNVADQTGGSVLSSAIQGNHLDILQLLLDKGADPNANGGAALATASGEGNAELVKLLVAKGANVNARRLSDGESPLMLAAAAGQAEVVHLLLGYGADPNAMAKNDLTKYGALTALIAAAMYKGNAETVRELLAGGASIEARDMEGATALMQASTKGNVEVVKALLAGGADINAKSSQGETSALMMAAGNGRLETTRVLLASGADVNAKAGQTALMLAAGALVDPPGGNTYRSSGDPATNYNHDGVVQLLIQSGADPNTKTDKGETALMFAAINNRTTAVRLLLKAGAEVETKDEIVGYSALMHAAERGHTETVKELIKAGADLNARNNNNDTALTLAEKSKQDVVVKLLEVAGAVH